MERRLTLNLKYFSSVKTRNNSKGMTLILPKWGWTKIVNNFGNRLLCEKESFEAILISADIQIQQKRKTIVSKANKLNAF